jgi:hypothetical protein
MSEPVPTPEQLAAAADQLRSAPAPSMAPPEEGDVAAGLAAKQAAAPAGVTSVDVDQLFAAMKAMQGQIDQLLAEKQAAAAIPVVGVATDLRDLVTAHAAHTPGKDHGDVLRLADDIVDAARNAAQSGDGGILHDLAGKMARALKKVHPGPHGDLHYIAQAADFAAEHLPEAALKLVPLTRAPAVTSDRAPVSVVQGSVTG